MAESLALDEDKCDILSTKPTERELDDISKQIGRPWRSFLIHLGVPNSQIDMEYENKLGSPVQTLLACLVGWREGKWKECGPVTWRSLLLALEKGAEHKGYADSLRRDLTERVTGQDSPMQSVAQSTRNLTTIEQRPEWRKMYVSSQQEVCFPVNVGLSRKYARLMGELKCSLEKADRKKLICIHTVVRQQFHFILHGVTQGELPQLGETPKDIHDFISARSTPYEIFLVQDAISNLRNKGLSKSLKAYEDELRTFFEERLSSFKTQQVSLMTAEGLTHMAVEVKTNSSELPLSRVLEMKKYFETYLQLKPALFEGFQPGCTLLFFAISLEAATFLASNLFSHLSHLRLEFDVTRILIFGHFAVDVTVNDSKVSGIYYLLNKGEHKLSLLQLKQEVDTLRAILEAKENELKNLKSIAAYNVAGPGRILPKGQALPETHLQTESQTHIPTVKPDEMKKYISRMPDDGGKTLSSAKHGMKGTKPLSADDQVKIALLSASWTFSIKKVKYSSIIRPKDNGLYSAMTTIDDKLLVTDDANRCIHLLTLDGTYLKTIGEDSELGSDLPGIAATVVDKESTVIVVVCDPEHGRAVVFDLKTQKKLRAFSVQQPSAVAISSKGEICIAASSEEMDSRISVHDVSGKLLYSVNTLSDGSSDKYENFGYISAMAFTEDDSLYVVDYDHDQVTMLTSPIKDHIVGGLFETEHKTTSLAISHLGYLVTVSEHTNKGSLYNISTKKVVSRFGAKDSGVGGLSDPSSVVVSSTGTVYVADYLNNRIMVFESIKAE